MVSQKERIIVDIQRGRLSILILGSIFGGSLDNITKVIQNSHEYSKSDLQFVRDQLEDPIELANRVGITKDLNVIENVVPVKYYDINEEIVIDTRKLDKILDTSSFAKYMDVGEILPSHLWVVIRPKGNAETFKDEGRPLSHAACRQLDQELYVDMATLHNQAHEPPKEIKRTEIRDEYRISLVFSRYAVQSAINFFEGYVNCLGHNLLYYEKYRNKEEEEYLKKDNPRYDNVYDKFKAYQKIATDSDSPFISKGDFEPLKRLLSIRKELRHSAVHPSPRNKSGYPKNILDMLGRDFEDTGFRNKSNIPKKELLMYEMDSELTSKICDLVVQVIKRVEKEINGKYSKSHLWMYERNDEGNFPEKAFGDFFREPYPDWASRIDSE